ncbi:MAG: hypothetical protein F6K18_17005 [Okeania sp. SIO2C2]|uniref:hypothetical protein n=1 Tax=Okeania sp. SIO2C2 TaxID=2607787 RepID=UPI0013B630F0|nr:hypothetical protein [Okeania sp. SIO2C2]NEP88390.1 hypothetical protein [Okeania sp. SIO2C2]
MPKFSSTAVEAKVRTYKPTFRTTKCIIYRRRSQEDRVRSQNLGENHSYRD